MTFKTLIIDDDPNGIQAIKNIIEQFEFPAEIVGSAQNLQDGLVLLKSHNPHLLFLDIEMKNESGFELLDIWEPENTKVIFCTGYDQYAIKALKKGAYDYILKPLDYKEFIALFNKLEAEYRNNQVSSNSLEKDNAKINIKSPGGVYLIDCNQINYLKADGRYTIINYENGKECTSSSNLGSMEKELNSINFNRIHKSLILNMNRVKGVEKKGATSNILFPECSIEVTDGIRKSIVKLLE